MPIVIDPPLRGVLESDRRFDCRVHLSCDDEADLQLVTRLQNGLIEKPLSKRMMIAICGPTSLAHQGHHPAKHIDDGVAGIAVLASPTEHRVHNLARLNHLQGLKAFDFGSSKKFMRNRN